MNLRVRGVTDHSIDLEWEGSVVLTDFLVTYTPNSPGGKCKDFEPSFNSSSGRNLEILKNASMCWIDPNRNFKCMYCNVLGRVGNRYENQAFPSSFVEIQPRQPDLLHSSK